MTGSTNLCRSFTIRYSFVESAPPCRLMDLFLNRVNTEPDFLSKRNFRVFEWNKKIGETNKIDFRRVFEKKYEGNVFKKFSEALPRNILLLSKTAGHGLRLPRAPLWVPEFKGSINSDDFMKICASISRTCLNLFRWITKAQRATRFIECELHSP